MYFPILLSKLLQYGIRGESIPMNHILISILFLICMIANHSFHIGFNNKTIDTCTYYLKNTQYRNMIEAKYNSFEGLQLDSHLQILQNELKIVANYVVKELPEVVYHLFTCILVLSITSTISIPIFLLLLLSTIIYIFGFKHLSKDLFRRNQVKLEKQNSYFAKMLKIFDEAKTIKLYVVYEQYRKDFLNKILQLHCSVMELISTQIRLHAMLELVKHSLIAITIYLLLIRNQMQRETSIPLFLLLQQYLNTYTSSLKSILNFKEKQEQFNSLAEKLNEVELEAEFQAMGEKSISNKTNNIMNDKPLIDTTLLNNIHKIHLQNVQFSYGENNIYRSLNITFEIGCYVIKGSNGSGKSSLFSLLLGLYPTSYGEIRMEHYLIQEILPSYLRSNMISYIGQNSYLLESSLEKNLLSTDDYNMEDQIRENLLEQYSSEFGISDLIHKSSKINWNTSLSGGQLQKLSIVKSLLKATIYDTPILLIDEPSNTLDSRSIQAFINHIKDLKKTRIIIIISHDPNLDIIADHIIDLKDFEEEKTCYVS